MKKLFVILVIAATSIPPTGLSRAAASPPAETIVFARTGSDGYSHLFSIAPDGTGETQLTSASANDASPAPKASQIAFVRTSPGGVPHIWVMRIDGTGQTMLAIGSEPSWSPYKSRIAYVRNDQIWEIGANGADRHALERNGFVDSWPAWASGPVSTGGRGQHLIAFVRVGDGRTEAGIYTMHPDGTHQRVAIPTRANPSGASYAIFSTLAWSPLDMQIAFTATIAGGGTDGRSDEIAHGTSFRWAYFLGQAAPCASPAYNCDAEHPSWSPGGQDVAYTVRDDGTGQSGIYILSVLGTTAPQFLTDGFDPAWAGASQGPVT